MGGIAFLFSGQGDQYPGMGKDLFEEYETAAQIFRLCESIRPGTMEQCFGGTEEELKETQNTQPCLFAMELTAASVLLDKGIRPDAVAGFSLGEVVAATVAGLFDRETGFRLVCKRGALMAQAAEKVDTSMAAVVKLSPEEVMELCASVPDVYPVNFNCPGQITVSGLTARMPEFYAQVRKAGGRALPLKVTGGFHSPFMEEAASAFARELGRSELKVPVIPLYSNVTAEPYSGDPADLLSRQIASPVQWAQLILNMIASGIDTFIEIGPGKTLTNMLKKIDSQVKGYSVSELSVLLSEVTQC